MNGVCWNLSYQTILPGNRTTIFAEPCMAAMALPIFFCFLPNCIIICRGHRLCGGPGPVTVHFWWLISQVVEQKNMICEYGWKLWTYEQPLLESNIGIGNPPKMKVYSWDNHWIKWGFSISSHFQGSPSPSQFGPRPMKKEIQTVTIIGIFVGFPNPRTLIFGCKNCSTIPSMISWHEPVWSILKDPIIRQTRKNGWITC